MFERVRFRIGLTFARLHFRKKGDRAMVFTDVLTRAHRTLVIFPEREIAAEAASTIIRYLLRRFSAEGVCVVIRNDLVFTLASAPPIKTVTYTAQDVSRWLIPRHTLLSRLTPGAFDAALDLNTTLALSSAYLCRASNAPLRISFAKPEGDTFYNFQVQSKESGAALSTYRNFLKCLDMF